MIYSERESQNIQLFLAHSSNAELVIETDAEGVDVNLIKAQLRFHHSFVAGPLPTRARQSKQALVKACSNKQRSITSILDLTAGWGMDGLTLACHGKQVTMLEQNELVYAIVSYSLDQLAAAQPSTSISGQLTIENTSAINYLKALDECHEFDCIYLDPMFPAHKSGAKPAKEMQILQALTDNRDIDACFEQALGKASKRVVVKRPSKAARLSTLKPDLVYREKTIRFDVYLTA